MEELNMRPRQQLRGLSPFVYLAVTALVGWLLATSVLAQGTVPAYERRVDAGGSAYTDFDGHTWDADRTFTLGSWGFVGGMARASYSPIAGSDDDILYQRERFWTSSAMPGYRFTVPAGQYEVTLKFAETLWNVPNRRLFSVRIEGVTVLSWFDIFVAAGGQQIAAPDQVFQTVVTDGELTVDFVRLPGFDNPKVNAIQVRWIGPVPGATETPSATPTLTPIPTGTPTSSRTPTPTISPTSSRTPSPTITSTYTRTPTQTITPTSTRTFTATVTSTHTRTPTRTFTPSATPTSTSTRWPTATPTSPAGTHYYVDSAGGSDANAGTSPSQAWQTLAAVHKRRFLPGDTIHLRRGSSWTGGLTIDDSGASGSPITITTYGEGPRPVITNPATSDRLTSIIIIYGKWVVVEGLLARDASFAGVFLWYGADRNIVRDIEATNVGIGVIIYGQYNLITQNYIHDPHMVKNTPGGTDDFGALGVVLNGSFNETSYNRMVNCIGPSYDWGYDGGAIEVSANNRTLDGEYIHHNWAEGCEGFIELGGPNGSVRNLTLAYNVSVNSGRFLGASLTGGFAVGLYNVRVENNTFYHVGPRIAGKTERVFSFNAAPTSTMLSARNNVFYAVGASWGMTTHTGFAHSYNLYYLDNGKPEFPLAAGEVVADPRFVGGGDLHLQAGSPAIDAGLRLGYTLDFDGHLVPVGAAPDLGAFEFDSVKQAILVTPAH